MEKINLGAGTLALRIVIFNVHYIIVQQYIRRSFYKTFQYNIY